MIAVLVQTAAWTSRGFTADTKVVLLDLDSISFSLSAQGSIDTETLRLG